MAENTTNHMNGQLAEITSNFKAKYSLSNKQLADLLQVNKSTIGRWLATKKKILLIQLALERLEQLIACDEVGHLSGDCQKRAIYWVRVPLIGISTRVCQKCCDDILEGATVDDALLVDGKEVVIWVSAALHTIEVSKLCGI